jgi:hypothetical protein
MRNRLPAGPVHFAEIEAKSRENEKKRRGVSGFIILELNRSAR